MSEQKRKEHYKRLLREILDTLEGGDVALDFEHSPSMATVIRIIANIAGDELRSIEATEELLKALNFNRTDTHNHAIDDHKELSK
jgi:hypothetical protein